MENNIYQRVRQLSNEQRKTLIEHLCHHNVAPVKDSGQLSAFVSGTQALNISDLKKHLRQNLPEYFIPSTIIQLESLPRLPNGKIDQQSLRLYQQSTAGTESEETDSASPVEETLINIWEQVLDFKPVGIHDNFFEIGGDSILSIQIVARARKAGIILTPNQLFEHQTIAQLARVVDKTPVSDNKPGFAYIGPAPLTPIQEWFFDQHREATHYWNQMMSIALSNEHNPELVGKAVKQLVGRHDSLRLSFHHRHDQWHSEVKHADHINCFTIVNLMDLEPSEQKKQISEQLVTLQQGLNLGSGGLFKGLYYQCGGHQKDQLILVAHHLVIDVISWEILLNELQGILLAPENDGSSLEPEATSFNTWSQYLHDYAGTPEVLQDLDFWESQQTKSSEFPVDFQVELPVIERYIDTLTYSCALPVLDRSFNGVSDTTSNMEEILLAAVALSITEWTNHSELVLGLERHGRTYEHTDLDLTRSVGWFTTFYPLRLSIDQQDRPEIILNYIKTRLREVPKGGLSYGLLRYIRGKASLDHQPPVIFNYLGKTRGLMSSKLGPVRWLKEISRQPNSERYYYLEVNAGISNETMVVHWQFSKKQYKNSTIEHLIDKFDHHLNQIIEHLSNSGPATRDFPEADISEDDLNNLLDQL